MRQTIIKQQNAAMTFVSLGLTGKIDKNTQIKFGCDNFFSKLFACPARFKIYNCSNMQFIYKKPYSFGFKNHFIKIDKLTDYIYMCFPEGFFETKEPKLVEENADEFITAFQMEINKMCQNCLKNSRSCKKS